MKKTRWILFALLLSQTACFLQKDDPKPGSDVAGLPAATQTGANTFGCLVNGKAWTPTGSTSFFSKNLNLTVDPSFYGGYATINAYRYISGVEDVTILITVDSLTKYKKNKYQLFCESNILQRGIAHFNNYINGCVYYCTDKDTKILDGICEVTTYDLNKQIFAGNFELTFVRTGCDTIKITKGRFDLKF